MLCAASCPVLIQLCLVTSHVDLSIAAVELTVRRQLAPTAPVESGLK